MFDEFSRIQKALFFQFLEKRFCVDLYITYCIPNPIPIPSLHKPSFSFQKIHIFPCSIPPKPAFLYNCAVVNFFERLLFIIILPGEVFQNFSVGEAEFRLFLKYAHGIMLQTELAFRCNGLIDAFLVSFQPVLDNHVVFFPLLNKFQNRFCYIPESSCSPRNDELHFSTIDLIHLADKFMDSINCPIFFRHPRAIFYERRLLIGFRKPNQEVY